MFVNRARREAAVPLHLWSGKGVALLPLPPLRTVRATFIAYRSSISKALLDGETRQHIPALTSRYRPGGNPTFPCMGAPAGYTLPSSAFPYEGCLSGFLVTRHLLEVCSFSRRANSEPVSTPLQRRLRFLQHPLPAARSVGLATVPPKGSATGLPCSACLPEWVRFQLYVDGATSAAGVA